MPLNKSGTADILSEGQLGTLFIGWRSREKSDRLHYWSKKKCEIRAIQKSLSSEVTEEKGTFVRKSLDAEGKIKHFSCPGGEKTNEVGVNALICNEHSYACKPSVDTGNNEERVESSVHNGNNIINQLHCPNISSQPSIIYKNDALEKNDNNDWIRINLEHLYCKRLQSLASYDNCDNKKESGEVIVGLTKNICNDSRSGQKPLSDVCHIEDSLSGNIETNNRLIKINDKSRTPVVFCEKFAGYSLANHNLQTLVEKKTKLERDRKVIFIDSTTSDRHRISSLKVVDIPNIKENDENCSFNFINPVTPYKTEISSSPKKDEVLSNSLHLKTSLDFSKKKLSHLSNVLLDHSYTFLPANQAYSKYFFTRNTSSNANTNNGYFYLKSVERAKKKFFLKNSKKNCQSQSLFRLSHKSMRLKKTGLNKTSMYKKDFSVLKKLKGSSFSKMGVKFNKQSMNHVRKTCHSDSKKNCSSVGKRNVSSKVAGIRDYNIPINENTLPCVENTSMYLKKDKESSSFRESDNKEIKPMPQTHRKIANNRSLFDDHDQMNTSKLCVDDNHYNDLCSRRSDRGISKKNYNEDCFWEKILIDYSLDANTYRYVMGPAKINDRNNKKKSSKIVPPTSECSVALKCQFIKKQKVVCDEEVSNIKTAKPDIKNYADISKGKLEVSEGKELKNDLKSNELGILSDNIILNASDTKSFCHKRRKIVNSPEKLAMKEVPSVSSILGVKNIDFHRQNSDSKMMKPASQNDTFVSNNQDFQLVDSANNSDKGGGTNEFIFLKDENHVLTSTSLHELQNCEITEHKNVHDDTLIVSPLYKRSRRDISKQNYNEDLLWDKIFVNTFLDANANVMDSLKVNDGKQMKNISESVKPASESSIRLKCQYVKKQKSVLNRKNNYVKPVKPETENSLEVSKSDLKFNKLGMEDDHIVSTKTDSEHFCHEKNIHKTPVKLASTELPSISSIVGDFHGQNSDLKVMKLATQNYPFVADNQEFRHTGSTNNSGKCCGTNEFIFLKDENHVNMSANLHDLPNCKITGHKNVLDDKGTGSNLFNSVDVKSDNCCTKKSSSVIKSKKNALKRLYSRNISNYKNKKYYKSKKLAVKNQNSYKKNNFKNFNLPSRDKCIKYSERVGENIKQKCVDGKKIAFKETTGSCGNLSENLVNKAKQLCPRDCYVRLQRIDGGKIKNKNSIGIFLSDNNSSLLPNKNFYDYIPTRSVVFNSSHSDIKKTNKSEEDSNSSATRNSKGESSNKLVRPLRKTINCNQNVSNNLKVVNSVIKNGSNVPCCKNDFLISALKLNSNPSVSKTLQERKIDVNNKLKNSSGTKFPVVVLSDSIKKLEFLSYFNLQPTWLNCRNISTKKLKNRLCKANKNYNEQL